MKQNVLDRNKSEKPFQLPIDIKALRYSLGLLKDDLSDELAQLAVILVIVLDENNHRLIDDSLQLSNKVFLVPLADTQIWLFLGR